MLLHFGMYIPEHSQVQTDLSDMVYYNLCLLNLVDMDIVRFVDDK